MPAQDISKEVDNTLTSNNIKMSGRNRAIKNQIFKTIDILNQSETPDPKSVDMLPKQIAFFLESMTKDHPRESSKILPEISKLFVEAVSKEEVKKDLSNKIDTEKIDRASNLKAELEKFEQKKQNIENSVLAKGEENKSQVRENQATASSIVDNQAGQQNSVSKDTVNQKLNNISTEDFSKTTSAKPIEKVENSSKDNKPQQNSRSDFNPDSLPLAERDVAARTKKGPVNKGLFNNLKNYIKENPVKGGLLIGAIVVGVAAIAVASVFTGGGAAIAAGVGVGALLGGGTMTTGIIALGTAISTIGVAALGMESRRHASRFNGVKLGANKNQSQVLAPESATQVLHQSPTLSTSAVVSQNEPQTPAPKETQNLASVEAKTSRDRSQTSPAVIAKQTNEAEYQSHNTNKSSVRNALENPKQPTNLTENSQNKPPPISRRRSQSVGGR
ncbi:MAG: hypothetical protein EOP33_01085 [Rickettsiaceae bacterium]|nr:MAG: hypothetical protein EOP33_01085 [Rickettsiaceae bacterium]